MPNGEYNPIILLWSSFYYFKKYKAILFFYVCMWDRTAGTLTQIRLIPTAYINGHICSWYILETSSGQWHVLLPKRQQLHQQLHLFRIYQLFKLEVLRLRLFTQAWDWLASVKKQSTRWLLACHCCLALKSDNLFPSRRRANWGECHLSYFGESHFVIKAVKLNNISSTLYKDQDDVF